jgi:dihydrofolate reductase
MVIYFFVHYKFKLIDRNFKMRKIIVLEHISMDGIIQSPGGADEDTSGGFSHGGWIAPYADEVLGGAIRKQMNASFDLLLGRKTYDIWAPYWSQHVDAWPNANAATKYVVSRTLSTGAWGPAVFFREDIPETITKLKQERGRDLHVWGSGELLQTLIRHDLVDVFWLMIYPVTLGPGKRLFADGALPAAFKLTESMVTEKGVIMVTYERAG